MPADDIAVTANYMKAGQINNLLLNPGFEQDFTNWKFSNASTEISTSDVYEGVKSTNASNTFLRQWLAVEGNTEYTMALYAKSINGTIYYGVKEFDASAQAISTINENSFSPASWTAGGLTLTTTPNTAFVEVYVWLGSSAQAMVDNFTFYKTSNLYNYTLNTSAVNGSVAVDPANETYAPGSLVSVTASPENGYVFSSWSGDITSTDNPLQFAMDSNITIAAEFNALPSYTLTVSNGIPVTGEYLEGEEITIDADDSPAGMAFEAWTGEVANINNVNDSITTLIMPASPVSVTATYSSLPIDTFLLTVNSGTGGGYYQASEVVTIEADAAPAGQQFSGWTGATVDNASNATTTLTMPASPIAVTATYVATYTLNVENGSGSGNYVQGVEVTIIADDPATGKVFNGWTGANVTDASNDTTTLIMPAGNVMVTAEYTDVPEELYELIVVDGSGSGTYAGGSSVIIQASEAPEGKEFNAWQGAVVVDSSNKLTTIIMPNSDVTVTATYTDIQEKQYMLTVIDGTGDGMYYAFEEVTIEASVHPQGKIFDEWTGMVVNDSKASKTTLIMPENDVTVIANFSDPTSVNDIMNNQLFSVYPNPSSISIVIETAKTTGMVEVYSVLGEKVFSYEMQGKSRLVIEEGTLKPGLYLVNYENNVIKLLIR